MKFLIYDSVLPWALDVARNKGIEGGPFFTQSCAVTAVLYHVAQGAFQVPVEESDQAAVSLPSLENLEFNDLPSFVCDAGSYAAIRELLLGQFSNFLEARWLIWNNFNELEVEVVNWMRINKWPIKPIGPMIPSMFLDKRLGDDKDYGLNLFKPNSDGIVTKEEVERCIREVLESERSNAIRGNSDKLKRLAKMAVDIGGSSDKNIEEFVTE
ncbi:hypothetical protein H0E87_013805, partial [Populus deltoides]